MQQKRYKSDLTEHQWQRITPIFVVQRTSKWPLRAIVNGIFKVWDALAQQNELLDQVQTVVVDGGFDRRFREHLAQRGIQGQVPMGVLAQKGRFIIYVKRWVVERSIAWAGNNRRLAKDYERNTVYANAWHYVVTIHRLARLT